MSHRVVFMGSPELGRTVLRALLDEYPVVGIITQPDRPAGRGRGTRPPPVKILALEAGIPLIQPARLTEPSAIESLQRWAPDLIVVAAFGQILRPAVLEIPPNGSINVHASLLPRWRGASPVQAAILAGDPVTGVTIMKMDAGLDTGPILASSETVISMVDTGQSLGDRLARLGADLLLETLPRYLSGELEPQPQDDSMATYAPLLKKADGELDPTEGASALARQIRAYNPWPGSFLMWEGRRLLVHEGFTAEERADHKSNILPPGFTIYDRCPALQTANGLLVLAKVQPAGGRIMEGEEFLRGARIVADGA